MNLHLPATQAEIRDHDVRARSVASPVRACQRTIRPAPDAPASGPQSRRGSTALAGTRSRPCADSCVPRPPHALRMREPGPRRYAPPDGSRPDVARSEDPVHERPEPLAGHRVAMREDAPRRLRDAGHPGQPLRRLREKGRHPAPADQRAVPDDGPVRRMPRSARSGPCGARRHRPDATYRRTPGPARSGHRSSSARRCRGVGCSPDASRRAGRGGSGRPIRTGSGTAVRGDPQSAACSVRALCVPPLPGLARPSPVPHGKPPHITSGTATILNVLLHATASGYEVRAGKPPPDQAAHNVPHPANRVQLPDVFLRRKLSDMPLSIRNFPHSGCGLWLSVRHPSEYVTTRQNRRSSPPPQDSESDPQGPRGLRTTEEEGHKPARRARLDHQGHTF